MATLPISTLKLDPSGNEYELKDKSARQDLESLTENITDFDGELDQIKKSVSDGKTSLASAITQKGIPTEANDTLEVMADNILHIEGEYTPVVYSGAYTTQCELINGLSPVYNGFPYVYAYNQRPSFTPGPNNIAVKAEYEWTPSNDWHIVSKYLNKSTAATKNWLDGIFVMGLYNETTEKGIGLYADASFTTLFVRCYTAENPDTYTDFELEVDSETVRYFEDITFDMHYMYNEATGVGHLTVSYVNVEDLEWTVMFSQDVTLSSEVFGVPIYLVGPETIAGNYSFSKVKYLDMRESALVLDGNVAWGRSSIYPLRDGDNE